MNFDLTIIASGDSLRGFDFHQIPGEKWGINYTAKHLRDIGVKVDRLMCFDRIQPDYPRDLRIDMLQVYMDDLDAIAPYKIGKAWINKGEKLNRDPGHVGNLNSSTIFAINAALNEGYRRIAVLGADQCGIRHWYDHIGHSQHWNFELFDKFFMLAAKALQPGEIVFLVESQAKFWPPQLKMSMDQYKKIIGYEERGKQGTIANRKD